MSSPDAAADLHSVIARIERHDNEPDASSQSPSTPQQESDPRTGALADLHTWWLSMNAGSTPIPARVGVEPSTVTDAQQALLAGIAAVDRAIDGGATLITPHASHREERTARAVIALLTRREASAVLGQTPGLTDRAWMDECSAIRDIMARHADLRGDYLALITALDARSMAGVAGILLGAAARRTPCLIDGTDEWAGALVADRLEHAARTWWRSATTSPDPARTAARERIGLNAGLPLELSDDVGLGAEATVALLTLRT